MRRSVRGAAEGTWTHLLMCRVIRGSLNAAVDIRPVACLLPAGCTQTTNKMPPLLLLFSDTVLFVQCVCVIRWTDAGRRCMCPGLFLLSSGQLCSSCKPLLCNCDVVHVPHTGLDQSAVEQTVTLFSFSLDLAPLMNHSPPPCQSQAETQAPFSQWPLHWAWKSKFICFLSQTDFTSHEGYVKSFSLTFWTLTADFSLTCAECSHVGDLLEAELRPLMQRGLSSDSGEMTFS